MHRLWPTDAIPGEAMQMLPTPRHFGELVPLISEDMIDAVPAQAAAARRRAAAGVQGARTAGGAGAGPGSWRFMHDPQRDPSGSPAGGEQPSRV